MTVAASTAGHQLAVTATGGGVAVPVWTGAHRLSAVASASGIAALVGRKNAQATVAA